MYVISTNLAQLTNITWQGKQVQTGIYKTPTTQAIYLGKHDVKNDTVSDRKVHGGEFKSCYIFSAEQYAYWQNLYPNLSWQYGMFGENLTISGLNETQIYVGSIYKLGEALVQVTQPREPCYKFGVKFGSQSALKQFINHGFSGTYLKVLQEGLVTTGSKLELVEQAEPSLTVYELFNLIFAKQKDQNVLKLAIQNKAIPQRKRDKLKAFLK